MAAEAGPLIRPATSYDAEAIARLLTQLGYPGTEGFLPMRIRDLMADPDETLVVAESDGAVVGVLSLHIIPQLAVEGPFARVSYLVVDEAVTGQGIGRALLAYAESVARECGCDRMELHSATRRTRAHQFYLREGYEESPTYFRKRLA